MLPQRSRAPQHTQVFNIRSYQSQNIKPPMTQAPSIPQLCLRKTFGPYQPRTRAPKDRLRRKAERNHMFKHIIFYFKILHHHGMPINYQFNEFPYNLNLSTGGTVDGKAHTQMLVRMSTCATFLECNLAAHIKSPKKHLYCLNSIISLLAMYTTINYMFM